MSDERFYLVKAEVLPEVFHRVMKAKQLLLSRQAANVSAAVKTAGLSRSAFYKYKDCVYEPQTGGLVTMNAILRDETGALQALLAALSQAGASILTIHQKKPYDGAAQVSVTIRTDAMHNPLNDILAALKSQPAVVDVQLGAADETTGSIS